MSASGVRTSWVWKPLGSHSDLDLRVCGRVAVRIVMRERVRVRACPRILAVWPLDSRRVAWPHLCTLGWRLGDTRVEWSAIYPVPALSTCCRCPRDALEELADDQSDKTTPLGSLPWWAHSGLRATAAGRSRVRVCGRWSGPRAHDDRGAPQAPLVIMTHRSTDASRVRNTSSSTRWTPGVSRAYR